MPKKPGAYHRPQQLSEALQLLARPDMVVLAGGTELLASEEGLDVAGVVDLQGLGLDQVSWAADANGDALLHVGAMVRLVDLAEFVQAELEKPGPAALLAKAIHQAGPNTFRNAATVGGVVASRRPDSEFLAALLVLESELISYTPDQVSGPLADYLAAAERPAGLITEIHIPWLSGQGASERVARTPADYPIVSVTSWQPADGALRLAATGIAARPTRLSEAEAAAAGGRGNDEVAAAASAASTHPGDFRGDARYRAAMAATLTRRLLRS